MGWRRRDQNKGPISRRSTWQREGKARARVQFAAAQNRISARRRSASGRLGRNPDGAHPTAERVFRDLVASSRCHGAGRLPAQTRASPQHGSVQFLAVRPHGSCLVTRNVASVVSRASRRRRGRPVQPRPRPAFGAWECLPLRLAASSAHSRCFVLPATTIATAWVPPG
jgi:hypothetical protein